MSNKDPKPKDPKRGLTRLHDLEPAEISLVDSGANRRRMLVLKRSDISTVDKGGPGSGPHKGGGGGSEKDPERAQGFSEALAAKTALDAAHEAAGAKLRAFPRNPMGLVSDETRNSPEYRAAKDATDKAFSRLRDFNSKFLKTYGKEYKEHVAQMRAEKLKTTVRKSGEPDDMEHAELVAKGGPGSGPRKGGGGGGGKTEDSKEIGKTQSGKSIHEDGNKGAKGWSAEDHMDAFHAHTTAGMDAHDKMMEHPSFQAARNSGDFHRTPEEAAAISSDPKVREHQAAADKHHAIADKHYAAAKAKGYVHKAAEETVDKGGPGSGRPKDGAGQQRRADQQAKFQADRARRQAAGGGYTVHKAADDGDADDSGKKMRDMIAKTDPAVLAAVDKAFDGYVKKDAGGEPDAQMVAAGKAVARILTPFKGSMPPALAHQIVDVAGFNMGEMGDETTEPGAMRIGDGEQVDKAYTPVDEDDDSDEETEGVKKRDVAMAAKAANCVYKETMAKLGYRMYPDAQISMKRGGSPVNKKGEHVSKSASDTQTTEAPDLSGIADPKTRSAVELVMKSQRELVAKNADLTRQLDEQKTETRHRELVAKAAGWQHLAVPQDDLVAQLVDADKAGKEAFERVEKNFNALNAQAKAGGLFNELGSNLPSGSNSADALYAKMETAALGWVQKSGGEKCSKAEAVAKFMETPEGSKMYAEHQAARGGI